MPGPQSDDVLVGEDDGLEDVQIAQLKRRVAVLEQAVLLLAGSVNSVRPLNWFDALSDVLEEMRNASRR